MPLPQPRAADLIGNTPLVELVRIGGGHIFAKAEQLEPSGSAADRVARSLLDGIAPGTAIVEATCGDLGISLAMICAERGVACTLVIPKRATSSIKGVLSGLGAKLEQVEDGGGFAALRLRAAEIAKATGARFLDQWTNPAAVHAHRLLGNEIAQELRGDPPLRIDAFVAMAGTGALLAGAGTALKIAFPKLLVVAGRATDRRIVGTHPGDRPPHCDGITFDRTLEIGIDEAFAMKERLGREEGLLVGISSGANVALALRLLDDLGSGAHVVTVLYGTGERTFATDKALRAEREARGT